MNELLNEIYPDDVESLSEPEESVESVMYNVPEETTFYDEPSHENESEDTDIEEELPNSDRTVEDQDVLSSIAKKSFSSERCRFDEMSFYEKVLWSLSYACRFKLPYTAVDELLYMLKSPDENDELGSINRFREWIRGMNNTKPLTYIICETPKCPKFYLEDELPSSCCCGKKLDSKDLKKKGSCFLYTPIKDMIRNLLEDEEIELGVLRHMLHARTDLQGGQMKGIYSHKRYEMFRKLPRIEFENQFPLKFISFLINLDGVQCTATPDKSLIPLQLVSGELPRSLARKFILTPFLFLKQGGKDIRFNQEFLSVFISDMNELSTKGLIWNSKCCGGTTTLRVLCHCMNMDGPMKADCSLLKHAGGFYSCHYCMIPDKVEE